MKTTRSVLGCNPAAKPYLGLGLGVRIGLQHLGTAALRPSIMVPSPAKSIVSICSRVGREHIQYYPLMFHTPCIVGVEIVPWKDARFPCVDMPPWPQGISPSTVDRQSCAVCLNSGTLRVMNATAQSLTTSTCNNVIMPDRQQQISVEVHRPGSFVS